MPPCSARGPFLILCSQWVIGGGFKQLLTQNRNLCSFYFSQLDPNRRSHFGVSVNKDQTIIVKVVRDYLSQRQWSVEFSHSENNWKPFLPHNWNFKSIISKFELWNRQLVKWLYEYYLYSLLSKISFFVNFCSVQTYL